MINRDETILIVEDDSQIHNFIAYILRQEGFICFIAKTAQNAMTILLSQKIDLMILDMGLPDFDGMSGDLEIDHPDRMYILYDALARAGFSVDEIEKIAFGNALRVMKDAMH